VDGERKLPEEDQQELVEWDIWNQLLEEQRMVSEQELKPNQKLKLKKND
jgi:hypothetical protein